MLNGVIDLKGQKKNKCTKFIASFLLLLRVFMSVGMRNIGTRVALS